MNSTHSKILWLAAGVLLILAGIDCLVHPGNALNGITLLLGCIVLLAGVVNLIIFAAAHSALYGAGWFLLDGILTVLMAVFILGNRVFTALTLPFILGMWLLFSGISKIVHSLDFRRLGVPGWGWFTALGVALTLAGISAFSDPLSGAVALGWMAGWFLILQGVSSILRGIYSSRFWM